MHPLSTTRRKIHLAAVAAMVAGSVAMIWTILRYLHAAALEAVPFEGHTLQLGREYVYANRIAVLFLIVFSALLAHAVARLLQLISHWRDPAQLDEFTTRPSHR